MDLSIVTSLYRSAPHILDFYRRVTQEARKVTEDFELIFVNDGSPDNSLEIVRSWLPSDGRIKIIDLSRNFGHHPAIMTGLEHARGDLVFLIDSDLEEAPELLARFYEEMRSSEADVVYGVQETRNRGLLYRVQAAAYFRLFNFFSTYPIPKDLMTARLMTARYVKSLVMHGEREFVLSGLWVITGYKQVGVSVPKLWKRASSYDFTRKINLLVNSITAFSARPLILIFYLAWLILGVALIGVLSLVVGKIFFHIGIVGWTSVIVSVWMVGGILILCLGVIGIYISKLFLEAKARPRTIIRDIYQDEAINSHEPELPLVGEATPHRQPARV